MDFSERPKINFREMKKVFLTTGNNVNMMFCAGECCVYHPGVVTSLSCVVSPQVNILLVIY